jgi:signal transduction histidine kinase
VARFVVLNRQIDRLNEEIRERRRAEQEVLALNTDLERKVRERTAELEAANTELDAFAAAVSHDLRAPLRAILLASRVLAEDAADRLLPEDLEVLQRQSKAALSMSRLVEALLKMARFARAEIRRQDVDLTRLAQEAFEDARREYASCGTRFHAEPGLKAHADPDLLRFALENLLTNACKFSCYVAEPKVEVGRRGAAFFVRDNGIGFDPASASELFTPFGQIHEDSRFRGTGIGLTNVQRIVVRHGGTVWAESQPGEGAVFYFTLGGTEA